MGLGPWGALLVFGGGACFLLALVHLLAAARLPARGLQAWLGSLGLLSSLKAMSEALLYAAPDPDAYGLRMKWQLAVTFLWACGLIGYVRAHVGSLRRTCVVAWIAMGVALVVDLAQPHGMVFTRVESLRDAALPWGETISIGQGPIAGTRWLLDLTGLVVAVFLAAACVRAFRTRPHGEAWLLSVACTVIVVLALGHGWLVDLGAVDLPYLVTPAMFVFLGVFSATLAGDLVRSSRLEHEVAAHERRWNALMNDVDHALALVDAAGRITFASPRLCEITGRAREDLVGSDFLQLAPATEHEAQRRLLEHSDEWTAPVSVEVLTRLHDGSLRPVLWSSVVLHDAAGQRESLCLGIDVAAQRDAEQARDIAQAEVERLQRQIDHEVLRVGAEHVEPTGEDPLARSIVGHSNEIQYVRHKIRQVASTEASVLIQGETGVGKELVGSAIHEASRRSAGRLVVLDCSAIPGSLFESELFGVKAGAFTDARIDRVGRFELADGGTLFLDEVGELPLDVQPKLLRALQTGEFARVGCSVVRHSDVRVVAATNRELSAEVAAGRFRADLFYRLNVFPLTVPPLRARLEDLPDLVAHLLPRLAAKSGASVQEVPGAVMRELLDHDWPGNVRELTNVLQRALILGRGGRLRLAERLGDGSAAARSRAGSSRLDDVVRGHIEKVLRETRGRITGPRGAAEVLGVNPSTLRGRMRKLGVRRES